MPSTSKKQAKFMRAVAHSPSFAKKVGVSQSVGKDFSAADKGRKFNAGGKTPPMPPATPPEKRPPNFQDVKDEKIRKEEESAPTTRSTMGKRFASGGVLKAKINRQDTRHGKMDMPFSSLKRFTGMKKGGGVKRYVEGGVMEGQNPNIDDDTRARALAWVKRQQEGGGNEPSSAPAPQRKAAPAPAPAPASSKPSLADEKDFGAINEDMSRYEKAVTGRTYKRPPMLKTDSPEYEKNRQLLGNVALGMASLAPAGKALNAGRAALADRARRADQISSMAERKAMLAARRAEREYDLRRARDMEAGYRKGGNVKESKAMMKKEIGFMQKKGAPKSMIKHEMAEAKEMKFARGGGIESRGKTKGTVIKMASGGAVKGFARGGGIEQRGKTRGKMC